MKSKTISIRPEKDEDLEAVYLVNEKAFGRSDEARLVDRLRATTQWVLSLVAEFEDRIVGHVLFTRVAIHGTIGETHEGAGLGPVAVLPDHQGRGIGGALIHRGISQVTDMGMPFVVVLGHSEYYPRFGFEVSTKYGIRCQWDVPEPAFMVMPLQPGGLENRQGIVYYASEFETE